MLRHTYVTTVLDAGANPKPGVAVAQRRD